MATPAKKSMKTKEEVLKNFLFEQQHRTRNEEYANFLEVLLDIRDALVLIATKLR